MSHPTFEMISSYADQAPISAPPHGDFWHHLARCRACAGVMCDIRDLGELARRLEQDGMSEEVEARLRHALGIDDSIGRDVP